MIYCNNCGVELETDMQLCPLCGEKATNNIETGLLEPAVSPLQKNTPYAYRKMDQPQKKFTWEIVSIILLSGVIASFIIDFAINRHISWSEYIAAICLTIFSYVSTFAFWNQKTIIDMAGGLIASSFFLLIIDVAIGTFDWAIKLGIPLLFSSNIVVASLLTIIQRSQYKGINLIAYSFIAAALLCVCIECILSFIDTNSVHLWWSLIVMACVLPVAFLLLFLHFRLQKGRSLQKTFHI